MTNDFVANARDRLSRVQTLIVECTGRSAIRYGDLRQYFEKMFTGRFTNRAGFSYNRYRVLSHFAAIAEFGDDSLNSDRHECENSADCYDCYTRASDTNGHSIITMIVGLFELSHFHAHSAVAHAIGPKFV